jgi:hypothetical protein
VATNNTLEVYVQPISQASAALDVGTPLSFRDWYKSRTGLISGQEYNQYNTYLIEWYQNKQKENQDTRYQIQLAYLALLKQLQIFSDNTETEKWYNEINFNDEREILIAIPYFARKLKDIALYYLRLRETVKDSKINHNHIGTNKGITRQLQKLLLNTFTKKQNSSITLPASLWSSVAELSSINKSLVVTLEELYDDHHYGDQSTTIPASAYYNFDDLNLQNYFNTINLSLSNTEWIYKQGSNSISLQSLVTNVEDALRVYTKYISEEKYIDLLTVTGQPILSTLMDTYSLNIESGLNYFFWPSGAYRPEVSTASKYIPIPLSATNTNTLGTPNTNIAAADTIFIKTAEGVEGAWLRFKEFEEVPSIMETYLEGNKKTVFKFPYPGFGLSAEDTDWSGPSIKYTPEFYYLEENIKKLVEKTYWNYDVSLSGADSIKLADTSLTLQGGYASDRYDLADKIRIRVTPPTYESSIGYGTVEEAWLYKMTKTDIPLTIGNNLLVWPYQRITNEDSYPNYFPTNISTVCEPISLSSIPLPFATGSDSISSLPDIIYKLNNYTDNADQAVECAWLSGATYNYTIKQTTLSGGSSYVGISQPGLNSIFLPDTITRFVWEGEDYTNANAVFKPLQHQPDCTFVTTPSSTYEDHRLCSCRAVLFSPFGHPGARYTDNNRLADYIAELDGSFDDNLALDKTDYFSTSAFAFFKTNKKIGWGDGQWYSGDKSINNNFYLRKGRAYIYNRSTSPNDPEPTTFPFLVTRYPYQNPNSIWIGAKKITNQQSNNPNQDDPTVSWVSTDSASPMVIRPGDILLYVKSNSTEYSIISSSSSLVFQPTAYNVNSIWCDFDYTTIGNGQFNVPQPITVSYPNAFYPFGALANPDLSGQYIQYPPVLLGNVIWCDWELTDPNDRVYQFFETLSFTFTPVVTGTYTISLVRGLSANRVIPNTVYYPDDPSNTGRPVSGTFEFTTIPEITAGDYFFRTDSIEVSSFSRSVPGFVINSPLYGWNYNYGLPDRNSNGAKPYWAQGNLEYKDVISWGASYRLADEYNIITQPFFSEMVLRTGNYVEYDRKYPKSFFWNEPINYKVQVNSNIWSTIQIVTTATSNLESILGNLTNQAIAIPTNDPSPIQITNIVQNQPVEVYYKAIDSFIWDVSAIPEIDNTIFSSKDIVQAVQPLRPWDLLTNRFFSNYAIFPALDNLYSANDKGGFFTPNYLGISTYLNKDYTSALLVSSTALSSFFEDPEKHIGGRGFSQQDQPTPYYNKEDNNVWLKEPVVSGPIAGTLKKGVTKKYQKFIPYQSAYDSNNRNRTGIILPISRQTPWGGINDAEWTDLANKPQNFSGVVNVSAWSTDQVLKQQQNKLLDNWATDIFGNQYGLYKQILNIAPENRREIPGELWVRKNSQTVLPGRSALSAVFDSYKNTNLINDLTGTGINKIDLFFDTLYIETTGAVIFEDLDYNYSIDTIFSITDNARALSLALPINLSLVREISAGNSPLINYNYAVAGDTWFFSDEKAVIISTCYCDSGRLYPELFKLDLNTKLFTKIFPIREEDKNTIIFNGASNNQRPLLTYNEITNEFLYSVVVNNNNLVELFIKYLPEPYLVDGKTYSPLNAQNITSYTNQTLALTATSTTPFTYQVNALNTPTSFSITDAAYDWVTVSSTGLFTGTPLTSGNFFVPFIIFNSYGPIYYSLNITVSS